MLKGMDSHAQQTAHGNDMHHIEFVLKQRNSSANSNAR
jgi:hypothetical protein